jgi:cytidylate kinase
MGMVITIDGPAASGKSSVSRELAKRLGWQWVSTGAFYRGLAFVAMQLGIPLDDVEALSKLAHSDQWEVRLTEEQTLVFFKSQDVTEMISREDVGSYASKVSHYPEVRKALLEAQRKCSEGPQGLVAEGRDCGTVVFPVAEAKVYLTANSDDRAARRAAEHGTSAAIIKKAQEVRDLQDSTRTAAPLQVPTDAYVVDTSSLSLNEVVDQVEAFVAQRI